VREEQHLRVPEAVAWLAMGLEQALEFGTTIGAISSDEADSFMAEGWETLLKLGEMQSARIESETPTTRFLDILLTLLAQHRAHLEAKSGGEPDEPEAWGWVDLKGDSGDKKFHPGSTSELVGWVEDDLVYLMPEAAHKAVARFCRDQGEPFPIIKAELLRRLEKEGILIPFVKEGKTKRTGLVWCSGQNRRVARLKANAFQKN
jgi:hypothetical protein